MYFLAQGYGHLIFRLGIYIQILPRLSFYLMSSSYVVLQRTQELQCVFSKK